MMVLGLLLLSRFTVTDCSCCLAGLKPARVQSAGLICNRSASCSEVLRLPLVWVATGALMGFSSWAALQLVELSS